MRVIRQDEFVEGRWRNGRGRSWDIASDGPFSQSGAFGWRFAIAEIAGSGPFSHYEGVDRVFMLIQGEGVRLDFADGTHLDIAQNFVPHHYACDIPTECTLKGGTARALNLFYTREHWRAEVEILRLGGMKPHHMRTSLLLALQGSAFCNGIELREGDAAVLKGTASFEVRAASALLYAARLLPRG